MWKCIPRRAREFERGANHLHRRNPGELVNTACSDDKNKRLASPCEGLKRRQCWSSDQNGNNTNDGNKWDFHHLTSSWMTAIRWSGAFVFGWYSSQLIHLKFKYHSMRYKENCAINLLSSLRPCIEASKNRPPSKVASNIDKLVVSFVPTVHLVTNEQCSVKKERSFSNSTKPESSNDLMGEVLNSIENKLGLAALENGQLQDGINLLRSAANRHYAPALFNLGRCYEIGLGVVIDEKMAMELYRAAAILEHPGALYNLGIYYGQGRGGLTRDTIKATRLLRLAAVQGQEEAIAALKDLDADIEEPTPKPIWSYLLNSKLHTNSELTAVPTTLFVENVNLSHGNEGTVY